MNKQKLMVLLAFSFLVIVATIIGCTAVREGFLIPVQEAAAARFAFVVNGNVFANDPSVTLSAYKINADTGALTLVPGSPFDTGASDNGTVFIDVDPNSRFVYVPLQSLNTIAVFSVDQTTGALTPVSGSPFPSGGNYTFAAKVDPSGRFLYVSIRGSGTVAAFSIGSNGALTPIGAPVGTNGEPFQIMMDPQGRFLYVSVESEGDFIQEFSINASTGALTAGPSVGVCRPRSGTVDFTGHFLLVALTGCDTVAVYNIDQNTGALTPVNGSPFDTGNGPFHVVEVANGNQTFMVVNNQYEHSVSVFTFNTSAGALGPVSGSPFTFNDVSQRTHYMAVDTSGKFGYVVDFGSCCPRAPTIAGVTINANGQLTQIPGSPFTAGLGGANTGPTQIVLGH